VLEKEERTLNDRINFLAEAIDQKIFSIEKINAKLDAVLRDIEQVKLAVNQLDYQIAELQRSTAAALDLQKKLIR
jgi:chromosome segregation ATPase